MRYAIHDAQGKILRVLTCPEDQLEVNLGTGESATEITTPISDVSHYFDGTDFVPIPPAAYDYERFDYATKTWIDPRTLADAKAAARQRMAAAWNEARTAGVTIAGKVAPTDADSWTRYLAIKAMAADGGWIDVPIPLADGTFELLTQAKLATLWSSLKSMERSLLEQLRDRADAIAAATTKEEVDAITWG
jgi:hypothetical protein